LSMILVNRAATCDKKQEETTCLHGM
jgi:hypothetical protein